MASLPLLYSVRAYGHGFGQRYDLPLPLTLWVIGAAFAIVLSFLVISIAVRANAPVEAPAEPNHLGWRIDNGVTSKLRLIAQLCAVAALILVVAAGIFGDQTPTRNLAPTAIWIAWWVGFSYLSAFVGNVWSLVNPWTAIFDWCERMVSKPRTSRTATVNWPRKLRSLAGNRFVHRLCLAGADLGRSIHSVATRVVGHWLLGPHLDGNVHFRSQHMADTRRSLCRWRLAFCRSSGWPRFVASMTRAAHTNQVRKRQKANRGSVGPRPLLSRRTAAAKIDIATAGRWIGRQRKHKPLAFGVRRRHAFHGNFRRSDGDPVLAAHRKRPVRDAAGVWGFASCDYQYAWTPGLLPHFHRGLPARGDVDRACLRESDDP